MKDAEQQLFQAVEEKKVAVEKERVAFNKEASQRGYVRLMPKEQREGKQLQKQAEQKVLKLCGNRRPSDKQCESFEDEFENKFFPKAHALPEPIKEHALRALNMWRLAGRQHIRVCALEKVIQPAQKKQRVIVAQPPVVFEEPSEDDVEDMYEEEFIQYA